MKTKKVLSVLLALAITMPLPGSFTALAAAPVVSEDEKVITLYTNDFENETVDEAPAFKKANGTTAVNTTHGVVGQDNEGENKYVEMKSLPSGPNTLLMDFDNGAKASGGKLKIEFDMNLGTGINDGAKGSPVKASLVQTYTKNNYFMYMSSNISDKKQRCGTTSDGNTYANLPNSEGTTMNIAINSWLHMSYTIDIDKATVQLTVSDLSGNVVSSSNVISNTGMGNKPFKAMAFVLGNGYSSIFIDNIEVYNIVPNTNVIFSDDFEENEVGGDIVPANWYGGSRNDVYSKYAHIEQGTDAANPTKYLRLNKVTETDEKGQPNTTYAIVRRIFSESGISSGKLYIDLAARVQENDSTPRLFLVAKGAETSSQGKMIGMWNTTRDSLAWVYDETKPSDFYVYRNANNEALSVGKNEWRNYKFTVDLDRKSVSAEVRSMAGELIGTSIEYFDFNYLDNISVCGIGLRSMNAAQFDVDNIVVRADQTAVDKIETGSNRAKITFMNSVGDITKEDISVQKVNKKDDDVSFENIEVKSVEKLSGTEYLVEFENAAENGKTYYMITIGDNIKYADGSELKSKSKRFEYNDNSISATVRFSDVPDPIGAAGVQAVAEYVQTGNLSDCNATLFFATYDEEGKMIEYSAVDLPFTRAMTGTQGRGYKGFTPTAAYKTIKAFIWTDDAMLPLQAAAAELNAAAAETDAAAAE